MKQFLGKASNINKTIIGKAITTHKLFSRKKDTVLILSNGIITKNLRNYKAIVSSRNVVCTKKIAKIESAKNINEINEGDIVLLEPNGIISVVYERESNHNAIFLTGKCNSKCIMCPQPPVKKEESMLDQNLTYISLLDKSTKSLNITGGEPTLLGNGLYLIIDSLKRRIPRASISLLTNGIKFENIDFARNFAHRITSNTVVDIPLYSDIDSIHNKIVGTKTFYKTINGIYNLAKFNVKIGIRIVVHKINYKRLPELANYIYSNFPFVYHVAFMQMEPIGSARDNFEQLWIDPIEYTQYLKKAVLNLYYRDLKVEIYNSQLCILPKTLWRFAKQSISEWKNIYIDECEKCEVKEICPGFFSSSYDIHSKGIMPLKKIQV